MDRKGLAALAVFFGGLLSLTITASFAAEDRAALRNSLEAANVSYLMSEVADRGGTMMVLSDDNVCGLQEQHPGVPVLRVYNEITGHNVACK